MRPSESTFWLIALAACTSAGCTSSDDTSRRADPPHPAPVAQIIPAHVEPPAAPSSAAPIAEWLRWTRLDSVVVGATMPRILHHACASYVCTDSVSAGVVCGEVVLRDSTSLSARIVGRLKAGDSVTTDAQDIHVLTPGVVRIRRPFRVWSVTPDEMTARAEDGDTLRVPAGDSIVVLANTLEGSQWWYQGARYRASSFWDGLDEDLSEFTAASHVETELATREWWHIRSRTGLSGWVSSERDGYVRLVPYDGRCGPLPSR